ncbi:MAG: hypothetical protein NWF05_01720 [Candidatus Bathyarchaeota archaeon]|nr:hypothetical protein [Candidatus Bathyarchaeota archaeon]
MTQNPNAPPYPYKKRRDSGLITALGFGGFLIIIGAIFASNPSLWQNVTYFLGHITTSAVPFGDSTSQLVLPAPSNPAAHTTLYNALFQFDIAFGILQLFILALRLLTRSTIRRIAETLGNAVFWLGAAVLVNTFLLTGTLSGWFQYWTALIIVVGVSLVARAFVYFAKKP